MQLQLALGFVAMKDRWERLSERTARPAAETVALQYALPHTTEKPR